MVDFNVDHGTLIDTDQVQREDQQQEVQHHYLDQDDKLEDIKLNEQDIDQYEKEFFPEFIDQNHDWRQERGHDQLNQCKSRYRSQSSSSRYGSQSSS